MNMPLHHGNFLATQIGDIRGTLEMLRLGVDMFYTNFPADKKNSHYLATLARPFYLLENAVDSWEESMGNMTEQEARAMLMTFRAKAFELATKMGPAAEAYKEAADPSWNQPKQLVPWRRISATKLKKLKNLLSQARDEVRRMHMMENMYLNLIDQSNLELADLALAKEVAQAYKERAQHAIQQRDRAEARARLAEYQAEQDAEIYEDQLAAANLAHEQAVAANNRINQEQEQLQQRQAEIAIENLCLTFQLLKI